MNWNHLGQLIIRRRLWVVSLVGWVALSIVGLSQA